MNLRQPARSTMPTKSGSSIEATESAVARAVLPMVLVLMGVSGSGKSTVALELHRVLGWPFQEGDDLHPASNVEKMRSGRPLDDADRLPWLRAVAAWIDERLAAHEPGIITCSNLKRACRKRPPCVDVPLDVAGYVAYSLPSRSWIRPARRWRCTAMPTWFGRSLGHST